METLAGNASDKPLEYSVPGSEITSYSGYPEAIRWAGVLTEQHRQLEAEIRSTDQFLARSECNLLQLDTQLKKLLKAVVLHLELEAFFLTPALQNKHFPLHQEQQLAQGYLALKHTCDAILNDVRLLKLSADQRGQITSQQMQPIRIFLASICQRLLQEDQIYSAIDQYLPATPDQTQPGTQSSVAASVQQQASGGKNDSL